MPNHITSSVRISGEKKLIEKLIKDTKFKLDSDVEENQFDFNGIVPMPEELENMSSPLDIVETEEEAKEKNDEWNKNEFHKRSDGKHQIRAITQATKERLLKEYGATDWYDWSIRNWGTKWNSYSVKYIDSGEDFIALQMDTAWDTPRVIWNELEERGYTIDGIIWGEVDQIDSIGDGYQYFYVNTDVEYAG